MANEITFNIKCTMSSRWIPCFLAMLKRMQYLGAIGSSSGLSFFSDGDGDYRPKFEWGEDLPDPDCDNNQHDDYFDAG